jgi:hypothetical protein
MEAAMAKMVIRDNALWIKHIEGDAAFRARLIALKQETRIDLLVDGRPTRWMKMRDGRDGRPTQGLKPTPETFPFWAAMQARRGEMISILPADEPMHLQALAATLSEWDDAEDEAAYAHLQAV